MASTVFYLMAEFGSAVIPLGDVAKKYLGISNEVAQRRAVASELPFPAFRAGSNKSPWMVAVEDLAFWLDDEREKAEAEWLKRNT